MSAPQMAIRARTPWYVRATVVVGIVLSVLFAVWRAYGMGMNAAGLSDRRLEELEALQARVAVQDEELAQLRSLLSAGESRLEIERAAQKLLNAENNRLLAENARFREEKAVFDRLSSVDAKPGSDVTLDQLSVRGVSPGTFKYSFQVALQGARRGTERTLDFQWVVTSRTKGGVPLYIPEKETSSERGSQQFKLKNFRRIEGSLQIPQTFEASNIELRIIGDGKLQASKAINL